MCGSLTFFDIAFLWDWNENRLFPVLWKTAEYSKFSGTLSAALSDHELLIAKFRLKVKKVGKTTRPSRYDLNQIHYDYTGEVRNIFKGLDLIDRVPERTLDGGL